MSLGVMPALVAGIHVLRAASKAWMAGTSPAMTKSLVLRIRSLRCYYQILPFVHAGGLAGVDHGGAVELVEDCGAAQGEADIEPLALVHRAIDRLSIHAQAPLLPQRVGEARAGALESRHF